MCEFFSFVHDGKKIYYFDGDQRKNGVKMPDGNKIGSYDSHSSITCYYKLDDDGVNKFEYNPYTDKLVLDGNTICEWDGKTIREQLAGIDWQPIAGDVEGAREFIQWLKDIPWFKPDGTVEDSEEIKLFETRYDAWDATGAAAVDDVWHAAWDAAKIASCDSARDDARFVAWPSAWYAAWDAAGDVAKIAARAAAVDAACYCIMYFVCGDLKIDEKHREYIRKRFAIWRHGYGVLCDVNGIIYAYKKVL